MHGYGVVCATAGSGTISGPDPTSLGCMLEMNERGKKDVSVCMWECEAKWDV
jgi:hypothetical protein